MHLPGYLFQPAHDHTQVFEEKWDYGYLFVAEERKMKGDLDVKTVRTPRGIIIIRIAAITTLLTVTLAWSFASRGSHAFASSVIETVAKTRYYANITHF